MKRLIASNVLLGAVLSTVAFSSQAAELDEQVLELLSLELASLADVQVVTAGRSPSTIQEAASPVTIITADQIRKRGYKTLRHVLDNAIPGFFTSPDYSLPLIANRGYTQNPSTNHLLLLNGHSLNDQRHFGVSTSFLFPLLANIKRIEVVRGPGSTLWGADAALGIINIITYDGADLASEDKDFTAVEADYDFELKRHIVKGSYAKNWGQEKDIMLTFSQSESDAPFTEVYNANATSTKIDPDKANTWMAHNPSYDLFAKARFNDSYVMANVANHKSIFPYYSTVDKAFQTEYDMSKYFFEIGYEPELTDQLRLEAKIHYDDHRQQAKFEDPDGSKIIENDKEYSEIGVSSILFYEMENQLIKGGFQYHRRDFTDPESAYTTDLVANTVTDTSWQRRLDIENAYGIFLEDEYRGIDDYILTLGVRYEDNDFRVPGNQVFTRAAVVHMFNEQWTLKYLYNTGYVRPSYVRSDGPIDDPSILHSQERVFVGPSEPMTVASHDIQALFHDQDTQFSVTLFQTGIKDFVARVGYKSDTFWDNGYEIVYMNQNVGDLSSYGLELEFTHKLKKTIDIYGNYAYALNKFDELEQSLVGGTTTFNIVTDMDYATEDGQTTGAPEHIWNIGLDWQLKEDVHVNFHYRGWSNNYGKVSTEPAFEKYGPEHYFDATVNFKDVYEKGFNVSVYGKNLVDNQAKFPMAPHGGYVIGSGRELGLTVAYQF